ncbi:MAG: hypothetical protein QOF73_4469 [Thermomicrobiales bacterium]|nr:hypothetical protein [Thermomicrobiales bacterium]
MLQRLGLVAVVMIASAGIGYGRGSSAATIQGFEVIGSNDLSARGMNAGMAIAGDCGYVGSRSGDQGTVILDLSNPRSPEVVGEIPHHPGSTQREARAVAELGLLIILNYRLDPGVVSPNSLDLYDITTCTAPEFRARFDFGDAMPHEFYLWRDPSAQRKGRTLAYVTMWGHAPNLRVVDVSKPEQPLEVASWDAASVTGFASRIHSLTVSPNGRRAYIADWDNGLMVLDTSALARGRGNPTPRLLTPPERWLQLPGGRLHSAVYVPEKELVVTTQEIYGPGTCPYGQLHIVDVQDPAVPVVVGAFGIEENDPGRCAETEGRDAAFTTHNPLVVGDLAFVSWYAGGLWAIDLRDPAQPRAMGSFVPDPLSAVAADDWTLGTYPVRMWSSPIIRDGLVYVVDIRNGLFVLRYTGPRASEVAGVAWAEGNAN